jgi:hypothetical protein
VPRYTRGIDVLYKYGHHFDSNNDVYVGMAGGAVLEFGVGRKNTR